MKFELLNCETGEKSPFYTQAEIWLDDKNLNVEFYCKNAQMFSYSDKYNDRLYMGDVCEAFICTGTDRHQYYEIEVAPNNTVFLIKVHYYPNDPEVAKEFIPIEECFVTSSVERFDGEYKCKFSVPLDKIGYDKSRGIWFNLYRIETEGGIPEKNLLAANPTLRHRFHEPAFFMKLK